MVADLRSSESLATGWREWTRSPRVSSCRWGIAWLEAALGADVVPGSTVVVGARTNVGKGYFSLELLRGMAESGPVAYLSLEDPPLEVGRRLAQGGYAHPNLHVAFPDPGGAIQDFEAVATSPLHPVAIGIDYIQCLGFDAETLTNAMNAIRTRTRAHEVVSIVASQVNRPAPGDVDQGVPPMSRLKGAGAIEERADIILMLGQGKDRTLLVEVAKAKGCPTGARARYRRGEGGRLQYVQTTMEDDQ